MGGFTGGLAALSLLALFKARAKPLWYLAIVASEWGHLLAVLSLLAAIVAWQVQHRWGPASWLALTAAFLFATPLLRALPIARRLPDQLDAAFGIRPSDAASRRRPLDMAVLFLGASPTPAVQRTSRTYAMWKGTPLKMDIYQLARRSSPLPGLVVVHGGSWQSGDREGFRSFNRALAARGYLVISMDYRLAPRAQFPAQRDDVFAAIAYLKQHAQELDLDPRRLVLLGRSAGGQIALAAAYAGKDPAIKGVIAFYAPNDLIWGYSIRTSPLIMDSQKVLRDYLGGTPDEAPKIYHDASPLLYVDKNTPPTLMIHGDLDELVTWRHNERLSKRLSKAGRPYFFLRLPWATHGCDLNFSGPSGQLSTYAIERFLESILSAPDPAHQTRRDLGAQKVRAEI